MIPDDLLQLFAPDGGPAVGWCLIGAGAAFVVVPLVLLACVTWEIVRGG